MFPGRIERAKNGGKMHKRIFVWSTNGVRRMNSENNIDCGLCQCVIYIEWETNRFRFRFRAGMNTSIYRVKEFWEA